MGKNADPDPGPMEPVPQHRKKMQFAIQECNSGEWVPRALFFLKEMSKLAANFIIYVHCVGQGCGFGSVFSDPEYEKALIWIKKSGRIRF